MNRNEQIGILENMFTWDLEDAGHFRIAFYAHYQILDDMLEKCAERFEHLRIPREDYFVYGEYIYIIYSELSVTIECLLKSILEENGYTEAQIRRNGHNLNALLEEIKSINTPESNDIYATLHKHRTELEYFENNNIFVDTRYMTYKEEVSLLHIGKVKDLILDLDGIFLKYYKNYNWIEVLYPDTM